VNSIPIADNLKVVSWAGVASLNRQDHASGTLTTRPSTRLKVITSSVTDTSLTRVSVLTAMLTPRLLNLLQVCLNDSSNLVKLLGGEAMILDARKRHNPERRWRGAKRPRHRSH
jgi:hypothetical protein